VLSGDFHIGMGDKLDPQKGELLRAGGFAEAPAKMNHFAWSTTETVVQVHGEGPFAITDGLRVCRVRNASANAYPEGNPRDE
jgi:hypothetical protein